MTQDTNQGKKETSEQKPMVYHDFNLRFGGYNETNGTFKVWVEGETLGGTMRPDDAPTCTFDPKTYWDDPASGRGGLLGNLERRQLSKEAMVKLGMLLADLALPEGQVRDLFRQSLAIALKAGKGLRVRLHIDPVALVQLPWEFLALPQVSGEPQATDFLALRWEISIVRTDTVETLARDIPNRPIARVVGVLSSPRDQKDLEVDDDQAAIEQAVQALNQAAGQHLIEVIWAERPATRDAVAQTLSGGADIFHFAGHATFELVSKQGQIVLERADNTSDFYTGEQLAQQLHSAGIRLAVLGACETGRRDGQNVWSGVAPALTRQKIPAVIANQFKIKDDNAILIATKVYPRLLAGYTVDEALFEARQAIYLHKGLENRDWGVPVLYLHDQSGVLFPGPDPKSPGRSSSSPFIHVANVFKDVSGQVVDVEIRKVTGGRIQISDTIDVVKEKGIFTSLKIDELG